MPYYTSYYVSSEAPAEMAANTAFQFTASATLVAFGGDVYIVSAQNMTPIDIFGEDIGPMALAGSDMTPLVISAEVI